MIWLALGTRLTRGEGRNIGDLTAWVAAYVVLNRNSVRFVEQLSFLKTHRRQRVSSPLSLFISPLLPFFSSSYREPRLRNVHIRDDIRESLLAVSFHV